MEQLMQQTTTEKSEIKLVGISVRTSYEQELNKMTGNILPCVQKYFHGALFKQIPYRKKPSQTFCAYTDYDSDYKGGYTYFIGEQVTAFDDPLPVGFEKLTIPKQRYVKFTAGPAPMPSVIINAWNEIWKLSSKELGGKRNYEADFEIYDERASDEQNVVLDIFIGINKE
jgi:predicted transcriptional regulator YdeE